LLSDPTGLGKVEWDSKARSKHGRACGDKANAQAAFDSEVTPTLHIMDSSKEATATKNTQETIKAHLYNMA